MGFFSIWWHVLADKMIGELGNQLKLIGSIYIAIVLEFVS